MNLGPNVVSVKNIARHPKNFLNMRNVKSAFTHHAQILVKRNCWNQNQEMDLGIAPAAKWTVVCAAVLFYMVTKQFNMTNVNYFFGFKIISLISRRANQLVGQNGNYPGKPPDTFASRTWLVPHMTSAGFEPTPATVVR